MSRSDRDRYRDEDRDRDRSDRGDRSDRDRSDRDRGDRDRSDRGDRDRGDRYRDYDRRDKERDRGGESRGSERTENSNRVYVGGLDERTTKEEVQDFFRNSGALLNVWVARKPPGFAFVEFEDYRDARDACAELNGRNLRGRSVRVELSGPRGAGRGGGSSRSRGGRARSDDRCYECDELGHFARECPNRGRGKSSNGSRRSRSPRRSSSRERSRRHKPDRRSASPKKRSSRSPSREDRDRETRPSREKEEQPQNRSPRENNSNDHEAKRSEEDQEKAKSDS